MNKCYGSQVIGNCFLYLTEKRKTGGKQDTTNINLNRR